jgi:UDP-glucose 4-epimerase
VLTGASLVVQGDGRQTRDFVYIDDVVDALVAAATAPGIDRQIINVGSGEETSIQTLIAVLGQTTQRQPEVIYNVQQSRGLDRLVANLDQARRLLDYRPRVLLREGLQRLLVDDPRFDVARLTRNPGRVLI